MVVFNGLKPDKSGYRKFKIRSVSGQDDYKAMKEVLARRFDRVFQGDPAFEVLPDIIFMDGGKGHVSAALEVIDETGFDIPVVGMVKDDKHRTRALVYRKGQIAGSADDRSDAEERDRRGRDGQPAFGQADSYAEISLKGKPMLFKYIGRMQEEVHRFAIEYHRSLRNRNASRSVLDDIKGIGPARKAALLEHFKSVEAIRAATVEEMEKLPEMNGRAAEAVWQYFHGGETAAEN